MAKKKQKTTRRRKKTKVASNRKVNAKQAKRRPPRKVREPKQAASKSDVKEPVQAEPSSAEAQAKEQSPQTVPEPEQASPKPDVDKPVQAEPASAEAQAKEQSPQTVPEPEQAPPKSDAKEPGQAKPSSAEAQAKEQPPQAVPEPEQATSKSDVKEPVQTEPASTEAQAKEQPAQTVPEPEQAPSKSDANEPKQAEPSSTETQAKEQPVQKAPEPEQAPSKSDADEPKQAEPSSTEAQAKEQPAQTVPEPEQASPKSDVEEPKQAELASAEAQAKEQPAQKVPEPEQAPPKSDANEPKQAEPASTEAQAKEQPAQKVSEPEQASSKSDANEPKQAKPASTEARDRSKNQGGPGYLIGTQHVGNKENVHMRCALSQRKRLSKVQKFLIFCIILVEIILLYVVFKSRPGPKRSKGTTSADIAVLAPEQAHAAAPPNLQKTDEPSFSDSEQPVDDSIEQVRPLSQIKTPAISFSSAETSSFSLITAGTLYLKKDFKKAYANFEQLYRNLSPDQREDPLKDFLLFKMAFCLKNTGDLEQANRLFQVLSQSRFPIIRIAVNYNQCIDLMQMKQYLAALTKAYQTIALIDAVDWTLLDETDGGLYIDWASRFAKDCQFLTAECLTKETLSLCDADRDLPSELWSHSLEFDPFINLSEVKLRSLLSLGSEKLSKALLAPLIQSTGGGWGQGLMPRWDVSCFGASFEELLARFVANTDVDIDWACEPSEGLRNRPVNLYMSTVTTQQFITVAAGCAGLLAQFDDKKIVNIFNPFNYKSLSEHIDLLSKQAISLWQIYLLTFRDDERISNAHFLIGLLQAQQGNFNEAIAEYKFTANRYSQTSFAPFALLNSSKLKVKLRDYLGARDDLKQLVQQYPNSEIYDQANMFLADVTMEAGLLQEATKLYRKVYNLGLSVESQRASVLGAGKCYYREKDYENAAKWLTRYVNLADDPTSIDFCSACLLLGKANMALRRYEQASQVFQYALAGKLPMPEYLETVSAFVKTHVQQGRLLEAFDLLENARTRQLSQDDSIKLSLLKAEVLRSMGMFDEAIAVLGEAAQYLPNSQLKAKIFFEQARCLIAKGDLESASRSLIETLVFVTPGPLECEVRYELANICLKLGRDTQVVSICLKLLASEPEAVLKQKTLELLASAYTRLKEYDKATLVLLGQWTQDEETKVKGDSGGSNRKDITTKGPIIQDTQHNEG